MEQPSESKASSAKIKSLLWRALVLLLFGCACFAFWGAVQPSRLNKVQRENLQPGTTAWQLTNPADNRQIEGYASLTSVPVGGDIDLFVNTKDASYTYTIFRMGWYSGKGGRKVMGPQSRAGVQQPMPATDDPITNVVECHWTNPVHVHVPSSWVSGIYLVKLHGKNSGKESYITFTVRDSRKADIVFQQSVMTYQAYNAWPGGAPIGGADSFSLYNFAAMTGLQIPHVSFSRPYATYPVDDSFYTDPLLYSKQLGRYGVGAGDFLRNAGPAAMEYSMVRWLEHEGYDVTYITDVDTDEDVSRLLRAKGYLSVGHDEYWSEKMRANVIQARDAGVSLGFFGGNYMYWAVELLPDSSGTPNRTIAMAHNTGLCSAPSPPIPCTVDSDCPSNLTCQNNGTENVCAAANKTIICSVDSDCPSNLTCSTKQCTYTCRGQAEQTVVGGNWVNSVPTNGDIFIGNDAMLNHWVFANTGLKVGDIIPGLIGIEYNGTLASADSPSGLQVLLHTQAPRFESGLVNSGGGFPLPANFKGDFNAWCDDAQAFINAGGVLSTVCDMGPIPPLNLPRPPGGWQMPDGSVPCSNPWPATLAFGERGDWSMTIYQAGSGAWVFNAGTNQWTWGLDDYFTGLNNGDGANNGPPFRIQCGYPWLHPGLVSCRNPAIEQITRNVLNKFINP